MTKSLLSRMGFILLFCSMAGLLPAQIWTENFNSYPDGTTTGTGNSWTSACGACASGDFFEVRSGAFEANDVNDFSTWESESISIAGCGNVMFQLDAIEDGDHEGPGCACNINIDYFDVSYSIDGGAFTIIQNWNGDGEVGHTLTGDSQNGVMTDADWGSTTVIQSGLVGNTLQLRVVMRNTSGTERLILDNIVVDCILPVEWGYFHGEEINGRVELAWGSAHEADNKGFEVERSANGLDYEMIGFVATKGNGAADYQFTDAFPLSGSSFYRIKQVDYSGAYSYSEVFELESAVSGLSVTAPAPNPASQSIGFSLSSAVDQEVGISLTDIAGRTVLHQSLLVDANARDVLLSTDRLPRGLYFLQVKGAKESQLFRVSLQ